jgi:short-subunit dehydrogenase
MLEGRGPYSRLTANRVAALGEVWFKAAVEPMNFRGRWVLVTGASSGLGREIARCLALEHGANLVLAARRAARLEELKGELERTARVSVHTIVADLSKTDDMDRVFHEATAGRDIYGVVLNAGVTHFGSFDELSWADFQAMLATNVTSVVRLTTLFLPYLEARNQRGGILLVASMAGLMPVPYQTAYSGTKAFLINFGRGLHHELEGKNVSVTTFAPGGIATEMTAGDRFVPLKAWLMPVEPCAREAVRAFAARRDIHLPGLTNRLGSVLLRFLPQRFVTARMAATYRSALLKSARH